MDAERAFTRAARARRRAALLRCLRHEPASRGRLPLHDSESIRRLPAAGGRRVREIPLDRITGTLEPGKAAQFDCGFRPAPIARQRWQRVWIAEHRGCPLPPISVARVDDGYAVVDGHHRVSVARARGALTIDAELIAP